MIAPVYAFDFLYSFDLTKLGPFRSDVMAHHDQVQHLFEDRLKKHESLDHPERVHTLKWSLFLDVVKQRWAHLLQENIQLDQRWTLHQTILLLRYFMEHVIAERSVVLVTFAHVAVCHSTKMSSVLDSMH
jgi:hypothetical protein